MIITYPRHWLTHPPTAEEIQAEAKKTLPEQHSSAGRWENYRLWERLSGLAWMDRQNGTHHGIQRVEASALRHGDDILYGNFDKITLRWIDGSRIDWTAPEHSRRARIYYYDENCEGDWSPGRYFDTRTWTTYWLAVPLTAGKRLHPMQRN